MFNERKDPQVPILYRFFLFVFYYFFYLSGFVFGLLFTVSGLREVFDAYNDDNDDNDDNELEEHLARLKDNVSNN